jgi:hypothetical protein
MREQDAVMDLVREVYHQRKKRKLVVDPAPLARRAVVAAAKVVEMSDGYDPEADVRMAWLRGLVRSMRERPGRLPRAAGHDEACVQFLLGEMVEEKRRVSSEE